MISISLRYSTLLSSVLSPSEIWVEAKNLTFDILDFCIIISPRVHYIDRSFVCLFLRIQNS